MKHFFFLSLMVLLVIDGCKPSTSSDGNPFLSAYDTPFEVPPFEKIKVEHYLPAFDQGMAEQNAEIDDITSNSDEPDFNNTILAFDQSGGLLTRVRLVFSNMRSANTNDELQAVAREVTPKLTAHSDNIMLNMELFARIKSVYEKRHEQGLDAAQIRVVEKYYEDFVRNGANLSAEDQEKLRGINQELSMLSLKFGENLLAETNTNFKLVIDKPEDLAGLPQGVIEAAAMTAKDLNMEGKWVFTLQKPSLLPFLQFAENRDLREKIYRGYFMRGDNNNEFDNKDVIKKMVTLRAQKANLLGFENHAQFVVDVNMAKTTDNVYEFLNKLWTPALARAKGELSEMQSIIDKEGGNFKLASWDWWYYAEKLRKEKYDLDESELKPYFKLENVRDGMFWVATKLFGITFEKLNNVPLYHTDAEVFKVSEAGGSLVGLLYLDYFPRDSKRVGAWCSSFRRATYENGKRVHPISTIVCNFTKPTNELPSLLTWDETNTLFHEFGHALHGLFTDGQYKRTAGVVPRDYVELPSQVMENWASEPEVLKVYARHYATGEVIPDDLIAKIQKSAYFNQGFNTTEYLAAAMLDMDWHVLSPGTIVENVDAFEEVSMQKIDLINEIIPRYRSTYFGHIFDGGYSAGYYVYYWAGQLDADAFYAFKESGDIFNPELAAKFRQHCLAECGDDEGMVQYRKFRGKDPEIDPLLIRMGLK